MKRLVTLLSVVAIAAVSASCGSNDVGQVTSPTGAAAGSLVQGAGANPGGQAGANPGGQAGANPGGQAGANPGGQAGADPGGQAGASPAESVPFHSEVFDWHIQQMPVPAGHCEAPAPNDYSYLWLSHITAMATSTHLGTGPYEVSLCIFGTLVDPKASPPNNGIPVGWIVEREVWTAANGDQLLATGALIEVIDPVAGKFRESVSFLSGGTGRFAYADGSGTGIIDSAVPSAVYDGTIRYGKKQR